MNEFWQIITSQKAFEEMEKSNNPFGQSEHSNYSSFLDETDEENDSEYEDNDY